MMLTVLEELVIRNAPLRKKTPMFVEPLASAVPDAVKLPPDVKNMSELNTIPWQEVPDAVARWEPVTTIGCSKVSELMKSTP